MADQLSPAILAPDTQATQCVIPTQAGIHREPSMIALIHPSPYLPVRWLPSQEEARTNDRRII